MKPSGCKIFPSLPYRVCRVRSACRRHRRFPISRSVGLLTVTQPERLCHRAWLATTQAVCVLFVKKQWRTPERSMGFRKRNGQMHCGFPAASALAFMRSITRIVCAALDAGFRSFVIFPLTTSLKKAISFVYPSQPSNFGV